jgi:hypothetical protein
VQSADLATEPFTSRNPAVLRRIANGRNKLLVATILKQRAVCFSPYFPHRFKALALSVVFGVGVDCGISGARTNVRLLRRGMPR